MVTDHKLTVVKWGNSLAIRLPTALVGAWGLQEGQVLQLAAGQAQPPLQTSSGARDQPGLHDEGEFVAGRVGFAEDVQAPFQGAPVTTAGPLAATVGKWGNSLAVRLPRRLLDSLDLGEGDHVTLIERGAGTTAETASGPEKSSSSDNRNTREFDMIEVMKEVSTHELFARLRALRQDFPADYRFDRDDANSRSADDHG